MKGLRRPHLDVHKSDQCPNVGTVNNAIRGAGKKLSREENEFISILLQIFFLILTNSYRHQI